MSKIATLFARGAGGKVLRWSIFVNGADYWTESGQVGGAMVVTKPTRAEHKNVGKANETTPEQQALLEVEAKIVKKKKQNYFERPEDIDSGFLEPQLAKPCAKYLDDVDWGGGQVLDDKLNGFACILRANGAFTRTNEQYHSIPHILEDYAEFFHRNPKAYVHGELFNPAHVNNLGKLAELIAVTRAPKDITPELLEESRRVVQFHWYDGYDFEGVAIDTPLLSRRQMVDDCIRRYSLAYVRPVRYDIVFSLAAATKLKDEYVGRGGEGKILKNPRAHYQHKRTRDLLKLKKNEDAEFKIVDDVENPFVEGKGNSAGCAESVWCYVEGTRADRFKANIEGSKDSLREMYQRPDRYKGKCITVRYQELSPYGIPLIPYTDMVMRAEVEGVGSVNRGSRDSLCGKGRESER